MEKLEYSGRPNSGKGGTPDFGTEKGEKKVFLSSEFSVKGLVILHTYAYIAASGIDETVASLPAEKSKKNWISWIELQQKERFGARKRKMKPMQMFSDGWPNGSAHFKALLMWI